MDNELVDIIVSSAALRPGETRGSSTETILEDLRRNEALGFLPYRCRRLLILTNWAYPYGGGEAFMKDSAEYLMNSEHDSNGACPFTEVLWLSFQYFSDSRQHKPHERFEVLPWPGGYEAKAAFIHAPGPITRDKLATWLTLLDPDVIHHQGSERMLCVSVASSMNIPILTGFHFWHGALTLSQRHGNENMLQHINEHRVDEEFRQLVDYLDHDGHPKPPTPQLQRCSRGAVAFYWASSFMKDLLLKVANADDKERASVISALQHSLVIPPVSSEATCCSTSTRVRLRNVGTTWNTRIASETPGQKKQVADWPSQQPQQLYITQVNVHAGKGSEVFHYCARNMPTCRFQCVVTDSSSEAVGERTVNATRKAWRFPSNVLVLPRTDKIATVYERTKILIIPSVVDETFCRVAFEGLMNGLPIVASPSGYMKTMLEGCAGCILMPSCSAAPKLWKNVLDDLTLFSRDQVLSHMAASSRARYEELVAKFEANTLFSAALHDLFARASRRRNVMIFAPWADQGLGVQARNYVRILEHYGENVATFIFSYKPYYAGRHQRDPSEWEHPRGSGAIYYSENIREKVTDEEIRHFVSKYHIGTAIIPETCWDRVFQIASLLSKELHVRTYAVPNVEILRNCELDAHEQSFDALLCNNAICQHVLYKHSPFLGGMAIQIGYAIASTGAAAACVHKDSHVIDGPVRFLCLGGMNAFSRKQIDVVVQAFMLLSNRRKKQQQQQQQQQRSSSDGCTTAIATAAAVAVELLVTNQNECEASKTNALVQQHDCQSAVAHGVSIRVVCKAMTYEETMALYEKTDVVIQVSKHEGLGIGFYEALAHGKPVVTLDVPPHSELIIPEVNGWRIPAEVRPSVENVDSPIGSAFFQPQSLADCIEREVVPIMTSPHKRADLLNSLRVDYVTRLSPGQFAERFLRALRLF